jgi:hypothetical protein
MDGFDHLFHLSATLPSPEQGDLIKNCETLIRQITYGHWQVAQSGITVDDTNKLIYFQGISLIKTYYRR